MDVWTDTELSLIALNKELARSGDPARVRYFVIQPDPDWDGELVTAIWTVPSCEPSDGWSERQWMNYEDMLSRRLLKVDRVDGVVATSSLFRTAKTAASAYRNARPVSETPDAIPYDMAAAVAVFAHRRGQYMSIWDETERSLAKLNVEVARNGDPARIRYYVIRPDPDWDGGWLTAVWELPPWPPGEETWPERMLMDYERILADRVVRQDRVEGVVSTSSLFRTAENVATAFSDAIPVPRVAERVSAVH